MRWNWLETPQFRSCGTWLTHITHSTRGLGGKGLFHLHIFFLSLITISSNWLQKLIWRIFCDLSLTLYMLKHHILGIRRNLPCFFSIVFQASTSKKVLESTENFMWSGNSGFVSKPFKSCNDITPEKWIISTLYVSPDI